MKVAFAHSEGTDPCDAQAIWLRRLLPELLRIGLEPEVYFYASAPPALCRSLRVFMDHGITCHITRNRGTTANFVRWYLDCLRHSKPDVFVPHHVVWALYAARWARSSGIPTIGVLHSDDDPCRGLLRQFGGKNNPFGVTSFVAVSEEIARLARSLTEQVSTISTIPCGVPVTDVLAKPPNGRFRICYLGRMINHQKRIVDVARAFIRVTREFPDVEAFIWGDGSERAEILKILSTDGVGLPVYCPGALENEDALVALRSCHAVVLLSDWEGTPTVFMEGMAAGVVPIARHIGGGTEDLIEHGVTGLLLEEDPEALVRAVRALRAPDYWQNLSCAARTKIEREFSVEVCAAKWATLLHELAGNAERRDLCVPRRLGLPAPDPALFQERRLPAGLNAPAGLLWRVKQLLDDLIHRR